MKSTTLDIVDIANLSLSEHIRPGDWITWGQGSSEPLSLVEKLIESRASIGGVNVFNGLSLLPILQPEHTDYISVYSYGALGQNARIMAEGKLNLVPCHYSMIPKLIALGRIPVDVVFVQVSPPGPDGTHRLGFCNDYLPVAMKRARLVIAEVNSHVPWTRTDAPLDHSLIDFAVTSSREPATFSVPEPGDTEQRIARHLAGVIEDGATLQYGIGSIPSAILHALSGHKDLGLHSGLVTDEIVELYENGALTNRRKAVHTGVGVAAIAVGSSRLATFMNDNPEIVLHQTQTTHGLATLGQIDNLVAINSALEIDLFGQVNAEYAVSRYVGAIGGQVDFMHAATKSAKGMSVIAMPATFGRSRKSRITLRLSAPVVTTGRPDVDVVVTEYGLADLRGRTLDERRTALIAVAAPEHREALCAAAQ